MSCVIRRGDGDQVVGIDARLLITEMVDLVPWRDWPDLLLVHRAMRELRSAFDARSRVSEMQAQLPDPAGRSEASVLALPCVRAISKQALTPRGGEVSKDVADWLPGYLTDGTVRQFRDGRRLAATAHAVTRRVRRGIFGVVPAVVPVAANPFLRLSFLRVVSRPRPQFCSSAAPAGTESTVRVFVPAASLREVVIGGAGLTVRAPTILLRAGA